VVGCAPNTLVSVYPFTRQLDGEDILIGRSDTGVFLVLPPDAVELLDHLAAGKTVGQAQALYHEKYNEVPDLGDLLEVLEGHGFVHLPKTKRMTPGRTESSLRATESRSFSNPNLNSSRYHFAQFPQPLAQRIFSRSALITYGAIVGLALVAVTLDPSILPNWQAYFFNKNITLMLLLLTGFNILAVFLHEMAHLVAARAVGVSCRLGISQRLWILVAETDMTGIWNVPRNHRFLPFLAGPLLDTVSASVLLLVLFAQKQGWFSLHPMVLQLAQMMVLTYLLALLWQCYFFLRTDFYYVIANFFRCRSLMKDTRVFIRNQVSRMVPGGRIIDQSNIPKAEMRVIRCYSVVYVLGRIAALSSLILIGLPVTWNYIHLLGSTWSAGYQANPDAFVDATVMGLLFFGFQGTGFALWIHSLRRRRK
jgi:putative peptide zinc metalloprotease protein